MWLLFVCAASQVSEVSDGVLQYSYVRVASLVCGVWCDGGKGRIHSIWCTLHTCCVQAQADQAGAGGTC